MSFPLLLVLMTLATYRLTRLVVEDTFPPVAWIRERLTGHEPTLSEPYRVARWKLVPAWVGDLVSCCWCTSVWVSAGVVATVDLTVGLPLPLLAWGAVAAAAAWVSHLEEFFVR